MNKKNTQQGVGMMEVLVSLFLLAIAVLGFVALQLRAVEAANESLNKIQAMNIARDLAERIRINPYAYTLLDKNNSPIASDTTNSAYIQAVADNKGVVIAHTWSSCYGTNVCSSAQMAAEDVKQVVDKARQQGMTINILPCSKSTTRADETDSTKTITERASLASERKCIYVAWDTTEATDAASEGVTSNYCTLYGKIKDDSKCIVVETY